jgi:nitrogenase-stabilizing/protective protein
MTAILEQLRHLSSAEEFFEVLDVAYDPAVLNVARLHILRRMGQSLADGALDGLAEAAARERCRAHLARAYTNFVASRPIDQRSSRYSRTRLPHAARAASSRYRRSIIPDRAPLSA